MSLDDIRRGFSQKTFLITGGTGFMGKVLLYKIMKEFPDFKNIYLLIRGKKSRKSKHFLTPQERLEKEIFTSACFDPIRESMGVEQFALLTSRVVGIEGDISNPHNNNNNNNSHNSLGISEESCKLIFNNVNFIIHMAATVNFDEKINIALHTNTLGSLRILSLAKECRRLESMVHISTCYVNYGVRGEDTMEKLYPLPFDPENMCKYILGLHEKEVDMASRELLQRYGFPNTYTFTKSMGEQLLYKYKGDCPLAIVRPSIVGCSYKEPCPGWVDALTAAGGLLLTSGLGIVHEISGRGDGIADIIPVDFVVNIIIKVLYRNYYYYTKKMNSHVYNNKNDGEKKQKVGEVILNVLKNSELSNKKGLQHHVTNITSAAAAAAATTGAGGGRVAMENNNNNNNNSNNNNSNNNNNTSNNNKEVRTGGDRIIMSSAPSDSVTLCQIGDHSLPFIYHAATSSSLNKLTWRRVRDATQFYWNIKKHPRALSYMNTEFIESDIHFWLRFFFLRQVPCYILQLLARLPEPIGSERKQHLANKLGKAVFRSKDLNRQFRAFTLHEWVFDVQNTKSLDDGFCKEARATFCFDTYMINWWFYIQAYAYGMMKYIIKDTAGFEFPADPIIPTEVFRKASSL